jgi:hypothetical protein
MVGYEAVTHLFKRLRVTCNGASQCNTGVCHTSGCRTQKQKQHADTALKPSQSIEQVFPDNRGGNPI